MLDTSSEIESSLESSGKCFSVVSVISLVTIAVIVLAVRHVKRLSPVIDRKIIALLFANLQRIWSHWSVCGYDLQDVRWRYVKVLHHIHYISTGTCTR